MSLDRELHAVFYPRPALDSTALVAAADLYEAETGDVNELVLGAAIIAYLESAWEAVYRAQRDAVKEASA